MTARDLPEPLTAVFTRFAGTPVQHETWFGYDAYQVVDRLLEILARPANRVRARAWGEDAHGRPHTVVLHAVQDGAWGAPLVTFDGPIAAEQLNDELDHPWFWRFRAARRRFARKARDRACRGQAA